MKKNHVVMAIIFALVIFLGAQYLNSPRSSGYDAISREALAFYQKQNPEATNLTAKVINYGCHFEIDIVQLGRSVGRVGWAGPGSYYIIK